MDEGVYAPALFLVWAGNFRKLMESALENRKFGTPDALLTFARRPEFVDLRTEMQLQGFKRADPNFAADDEMAAYESRRVEVPTELLDAYAAHPFPELLGVRRIDHCCMWQSLPLGSDRRA